MPKRPPSPTITSCVLPVPFTTSLAPSPTADPPDSPLFTLPGSRTIPRFRLAQVLKTELNVTRLNKLHRYLWLAGRFDNIEPLHKHPTKARNIIPTERCDLHLVWHTDIIYIKPLPPWLLNVDFWRTHISPDPELTRRAAGLLYTYTKLVVHKSDYRIAKEHGLLPTTDLLHYADWSRFLVGVAQVLDTPDRAKLDRRYRYGQLRLARLNAISRYIFGEWERGYYVTHTDYKSLLGTNFRWLLLCFAVLSVTLTAMQVGLATPWGLGEGRFEKACWAVSVGSLVGVVVSAGVVAGLVAVLVVVNVGKTLLLCSKVREERREAEGRLLEK